MARYKINEIFYSLQGEGHYTGTAAVFIRFCGCNLKCPWCDTHHQDGEYLEDTEIVTQALACCGGAAPLVVLTGGEPSLFVDEDFIDLLSKHFDIVAMESNGTHRAPRNLDFLTVSPKADYLPKPGTPVVAQKCSEVKVVFDGEHDPEPWFQFFQARHAYLQPCDVGDPERNAQILSDCIRYIQSHPWWRLSLQTQKIINVR